MKFFKVLLIFVFLFNGIFAVSSLMFVPAAEAQTCYETITNTEPGYTCPQGNYQQKKCYLKNSSNGFDEVPCPVPLSYTAGKPPICTNDSGAKITCPTGNWADNTGRSVSNFSLTNGRCYTILLVTNRNRAEFNNANERVCTVVDYPDYQAQVQTAPPTVDETVAPKCCDAGTYQDLSPGPAVSSSRTRNESTTLANGVCYNVALVSPGQSSNSFYTIDPLGGGGRVDCVNAVQIATDAAAAADSNVSEDDSCNKKGGAFSFILCPILGILDSSFRWLDERIIDALNVNSDYYAQKDDGGGVKGAWANFRNIAYLILIPILLVMVISTALGFSFVDAYTVKRALPRLFIAVIFIALSFSICTAMVEITNDIGRGTGGLIAAPFGGLSNLEIDDLFAPNAGSDIAFVGGAIVGGIIAFLSGVTIWGIAITIGLAVLAMIIVFVLLTLRELLIIFLIILAPIAILSWIFPGNDKLWKLWWNAFSKMLILFPLIVALLVSGRAFASVINDTGSQEGVVITTMIKIIVIVAPYFLIPATFKFAGGALGNVAGLVNNKSKGIFDRGKNLRAGLGKNKRQRINEENAFQNAPANSLRSWANRKGAQAYMLPKAAKAGQLNRAGLRSAETERKIERLKEVSGDEGFQSLIANDDMGAAIQAGRGTREDVFGHLRTLGYSESDANAMADSAEYYRGKLGSPGALKAAAVIAQAGAKTSFQGGPAEMLAAIADVAGEDSVFASSLYGAARSNAEKSQRLDLAGYSYGAGLNALSAIRNSSGAERVSIANTANRDLSAQVLDSHSSGQVWGSHGRSVMNLAESARDRFVQADDSYNSVREAHATGGATDAQMKAAEAERMWRLAELSNANEQIAYFSPENQATFDSEIYSRELTNADGTPRTREIVVGQRQVPVLDSRGNQQKDPVSGQVITRSEDIKEERPVTIQSEVEWARNRAAAENPDAAEAFRTRSRALSQDDLLRRQGSVESPPAVT